MNRPAPKEYGIAAVAALFGFVALVMAFIVLGFGVVASCLIGVVVAIITAIALWFGWRDAAAGPTGPRDISAEARARAAATDTPAATPTNTTSNVASDAETTATTGTIATGTGAIGSAVAGTPEPVAVAPVAAPAAAFASSTTSSAAADTKPAAKAAKPAAKKAKPAVAKPAAAKAAKPAAAKSGTGKAAAPKAARAPVAADGKPETLERARAGGADDLKQIKGVGPGLEKTLNELGFYHFDQIQNWRKAEIEWVDSRLKFKGRIVRDEWPKQAKMLAKGEATAFSKKVKKGDVY